jgi:branched-chain amino acid aminotransferase
MTTTMPFTRTPNPAPATPEQVAEVLANPGFGQHFTDHMVTIRWNREHGWHDAAVEPYRSIELDPAAMVLHYGQAIFEGLKAYRQPDGSIASFRPEANAARFRGSSRRLAMPELPDELFMASLRECVAIDGRWVPEVDEESLYFRPFMISTEKGLGVRPAAEYLYVLIASPAGSYFASGVKPVSVWLSREYVRAAPGGTGAAKFAGNYAASLVAQAQAAEQGCDQVVWLDAVERRWVEERRISTEEWEKKTESGELTEVFACGTAAVITPVGFVKHADGEFSIAGGGTGQVTTKLRDALTRIQRGTAPDPHGWMTRLA